MQRQMTIELLKVDSNIVKEHVSQQQLTQWGHGPTLTNVSIDVDKISIYYTCMFDIHDAVLSSVGT